MKSCIGCRALKGKECLLGKKIRVEFQSWSIRELPVPDEVCKKPRTHREMESLLRDRAE